jgi:hypothetical protein
MTPQAPAKSAPTMPVPGTEAPADEFSAAYFNRYAHPQQK